MNALLGILRPLKRNLKLFLSGLGIVLGAHRFIISLFDVDCAWVVIPQLAPHGLVSPAQRRRVQAPLFFPRVFGRHVHIIVHTFAI